MYECMYSFMMPIIFEPESVFMSGKMHLWLQVYASLTICLYPVNIFEITECVCVRVCVCRVLIDLMLLVILTSKTFLSRKVHFSVIFQSHSNTNQSFVKRAIR